jgi:hypothetical protein
MKLKPGDIGLTHSDEAIGFLINPAQKTKAVDNASKYNHALLIINNKGDTFEALNKLDHYNLERYKGQQIAIYRHKHMTRELFEYGYASIIKYDGKTYPYLRLFLHLFGAAKYIHWDMPVCSELVSKFLFACGLRQNWWGVNPDNLHDWMKDHKDFTLVYEGGWA